MTFVPRTAGVVYPVACGKVNGLHLRMRGNPNIIEIDLPFHKLGLNNHSDNYSQCDEETRAFYQRLTDHLAGTVGNWSAMPTTVGYALRKLEKCCKKKFVFESEDDFLMFKLKFQ
jgi:hypothetical protein